MIVGLVEKYMDKILLLLTAVYVISTIILLLIAARANKIAKKSVETMRKQRRMDVRPYVSFDAYCDKSWFCFFKLENTGRTPAYDIKLTFDKPIMIEDKSKDGKVKQKELELAIFSEIPFLSPNDPFAEFAEHVREFRNTIGENEILTGKVVYKGPDATEYEHKIAFDINLASRTLFDDERLTANDAEKLAHQLAETFEKIERKKRMGR